MLFSFSSDMIIIKDSIGGEAMEATETGSEIRERLGELARGKWKTAVRMVDTALICPNPFHAPEKACNSNGFEVHIFLNSQFFVIFVQSSPFKANKCAISTIF